MADITRGNIIWAGATFLGKANGTISVGDPIGQDGTGWVRAAAGTVGCQGFLVAPDTGGSAVASGDVIRITREVVYQTALAGTIGNPTFLSSTAGRIADASVGAAATTDQVLGWCVQASPSILHYLNCELPLFEASFYAGEATLLAAASFGSFYIANKNVRILGARESHGTAGTDGSAVTLTIEKLTTGTTKGSGVNVLSTTFNLKSTAATPVWLGPSTTASQQRLAPGDRLGAVSAGTLTSLTDLVCTVYGVYSER